MSLELNEKKLLIILKKYEHTSMYFESLLFDFYRITEINYDKPLKESIKAKLLENDILIHSFIYEKKTHRIAKEYFIDYVINDEMYESMTIIGLFLSIIIIQEHKTLTEVNKYLTKIFGHNIDVTDTTKDYLKNCTEKGNSSFDTISLFIKDKIVSSLEDVLSHFNKDGFNKMFLNLYDDVKHLKKETREFIETIFLNEKYLYTLNKDFENQSKSSTMYHFRKYNGTRIFINIKNNIKKYDRKNYFEKNKEDKKIISKLQIICKKIISKNKIVSNDMNIYFEKIEILYKLCNEILIDIHPQKTIKREDEEIILDLLRTCGEIINNIKQNEIIGYKKVNEEDEILKFCEEITTNITYKNVNDYFIENRKNGKIVEKLLLNTCTLNIDEILVQLNRLNINLSNEEVNDIECDLENKKNVFTKIFTNKKTFAQIKANNHYLSFLLYCSIYFHVDKNVLMEYRTVLVESIVLKYMCIKYKQKTTHRMTVLKELEILGMDTIIIKGFYEFLENNNFKYIEYALLSEYFDLTYEQLKKYKDIMDINNETFRKDTFIKFKNNTFQTIKMFKNILKKNPLK